MRTRAEYSSVLSCVLAIVGLGGCSGSDIVTKMPGRGVEANRIDANPERYDRNAWRHWIDADHDCQSTRDEVLVAESEVPVEFVDGRQCRVKRGRWTCPYTGRTVTDPARLDIDHLVPLENAYRSGGWRWPPVQKEKYANDLDDPEQLVAVVASANRSKGSRGPDEWLPPMCVFVCDYVREWRAVKARWGLSMSDSERRRVDEVLSTCSR